MLRRSLAQRHIGGEEGFSWRGQEVLRIEGFADAVFGLAVKLLVVSLEVPNTFDELLATMRGFFAFAISFLLFYLVWYDHYKFFRRYGLNDNFTIHLSTLLLFVVLSFLVIAGFQFLMPAKPAPVPARSSTPPTASKPANTPAPSPPPSTPAATPASSAPAAPAPVDGRDITVENAFVHATFTTRGGALKSWRLKRYRDTAGALLELVPQTVGADVPLPFTLSAWPMGVR